VRQGYTGGDIGIHGPNRIFRCVGGLNTQVDWTEGCMSVNDDSYIARITRWLSDNPKGSKVVIVKSL
jgi:hypothetical protein